ncbi:MAG: hypothetical protein PHU85_20305 [Phycisphaerae bacterium]|nr:hypothetical protein [Phycisphaerae bacterium]
MTLIALIAIAFGLTYCSPLTTSTPRQRIYAAEIFKRAIALSGEKQGSIAREMNGMDEGQLSRSLQGAGRLDFALLMACCPAFLRGLAQAIGEAAGEDPQADRLAIAVADRVAARLAEVHPRMARVTLSPAREEVVCR